MTFTISIKRWATEVSMRKLPVCAISSSVEITNGLQDYDTYSAEELLVCKEKEQHVTSFILWSRSRVHCDIGDVTLIMVNLGDRVGIVLYSKTTKFSVDSAVVLCDKDVWHSFAVLENEQSVEVKCG